MNHLKHASHLILLTAMACAAQTPTGNAALRYWSAFAQMQDTTVTPEQAKELQAILQGTAPYDDLKYRDLAKRNRAAVETLQRGTELQTCDWGIEYRLGSSAPLEHVRKSLALGRINILYAMHLLQTGDRAGGLRTIASGIRFSHDVSSGGPLMAAVASKTLLTSHLRLVAFAQVEKPLSAAEENLISSTLSQIGPSGLDWEQAIVRDFEVYPKPTPTSLDALLNKYRQALRDPNQLPSLQQALSSSPKDIAAMIPNPQRVLEQKRELDDLLRTTRAALKP